MSFVTPATAASMTAYNSKYECTMDQELQRTQRANEALGRVRRQCISPTGIRPFRPRLHQLGGL